MRGEIWGREMSSSIGGLDEGVLGCGYSEKMDGSKGEEGEREE